MKTSIACVHPRRPIVDAVRLLLKTNQRALPVVDDLGLLVGITSEGDFLQRAELDIDPALPSWLGSLFRSKARNSAYATARGRHARSVAIFLPACKRPPNPLREDEAQIPVRARGKAPPADRPWRSFQNRRRRLENPAPAIVTTLPRKPT